MGVANYSDSLVSSIKVLPISAARQMQKKTSEEGLQLHVVPPEPIEVAPESLPTPLAPRSERDGPNNYLTRTVGLLRTVQQWSAVPILAFATVHLASVVLVPALCGPDACDSALSVSRELYQTPVAECILALSTAVHFGAGIALQIARRIFAAKHHAKRWWRLSFQPVRLSGWVLSGLLAGHVLRLRWAPLHVDGDSSFVDSRYLAWLLAAEPSFALPGLLLLVASAVFHAGATLPTVLARLGVGLGLGLGHRWALSARARPRAVRWAVLAAAGLAGVALARIARGGSFPGPLARRFALYANYSFW